MVNYNQLLNLPSSDELPNSDNKPVDNEIQNLIPNLLLLILEQLWDDRPDWFFGVNMGIFHTTGSSPTVAIVPDAFLSLGVTRRKHDKLRLSYILWEENYIVPLCVLEIVSQTYGNEYDEKMIDYARLGVLYYVIYNPDYTKRDKHERFEVYRLLNGAYQRLKGNPVWMPEIGLGIGTEFGNHYRSEQEWLYWYDFQGNRFMTPKEETLQERQLAQQERQRAEQQQQLAQQERQRAEQQQQEAQQERQRAEQERQRAEQLEQEAQQERQQAQQERQRAEQLEQEAQQERQRAEQERQRAEQFKQMLRSLGVDPE